MIETREIQKSRMQTHRDKVESASCGGRRLQETGEVNEDGDRGRNMKPSQTQEERQRKKQLY